MGADLAPQFVPYSVPWVSQKSYICRQVMDHEDGVRIELSMDSKSVTVLFETRELLTVSEEGFRQKTLALIRGDLPHLIFEVRSSPLLSFLMNEDLGAHDLSGLKHFMLVTSEELIDVISFDNPVFLSGSEHS